MHLESYMQDLSDGALKELRKVLEELGKCGGYLGGEFEEGTEEYNLFTFHKEEDIRWYAMSEIATRWSALLKEKKE